VFIIIEGPTCAGKSTLIKAVLDHELIRNTPTAVHMGRPDELTRRWALKEYVNRWEKLKPGSDGDLVADRWHWGEVTYAPIYRPDTDNDGYGLLGRAGWRWTEMFLASRGAVIGMVTANNETLAQRLEDRGDDHVQNLDELFRVASLYEIARRDSMNVAAIHDTSPDETDDEKYQTFVTSLVEEAGRRQELAKEITSRWRRYTGSLTPQILLVGDKRNVTKKYGNETYLPFMPVSGNSGEFLLNALPDMTWRTAGMVNGVESKSLKPLWKKLGQPTVIALGKEAEGALQAQGVEITATVPHPQFVRRFHTSRQREYGQTIVDAANTGKVETSWTQ
jgi:hypothetical protein